MNTYIVACGFIIFDVLTGFLKALHARNMNSTAMREGLFHKSAEVLALIGSGLLEYACAYINLGFDVPLLTGVAIYICSMEFISILENMCELNPGLASLFKPYLEKLKKE